MKVIYYEEWEMACCGGYFEIGSKVIWLVSQFRSFDEGFLPDGMEQQIGTIDYCYDKHTTCGLEGLYTLTGIVKGIKGVYFYFTPDPQIPGLLNRTSGFLTDMLDCDYWTDMTPPKKKRKKRKEPQAEFDAYLVEIEELEIRPAKKSDRDIWT